MFTIDDAIVLAAEAHRGQRDKGRPELPYLTHPMRVMTRFDDPELQMIAILHDAVEDSDGGLTLDDVRAAGASERVVAGIASMTHGPEESNEEYWARLRQNTDAVQVKNADIDDNSDPARLALLSEEHRERLGGKYAQARAAINA